MDPRRLPGPALHHLDPADEAKLWTALSELRRGQVVPRGQLIRLTGWIPADLAARLLGLLDGGAELVGAQATWLRNAINPNDPTTPALAVVARWWRSPSRARRSSTPIRRIGPLQQLPRTADNLGTGPG